MAEYRLTNRAVEDLTAIWEYTCETWSEAQANIYYQNLIQCFQEIAAYPWTGRNYFDIHPMLYGFRKQQHIIFYQMLEAQTIEIIRILHGSMDLKQRIGE